MIMVAAITCIAEKRLSIAAIEELITQRANENVTDTAGRIGRTALSVELCFSEVPWVPRIQSPAQSNHRVFIASYQRPERLG